MSRKIAREKAYQVLFGMNFDEKFDYSVALNEMQEEWKLDEEDKKFAIEICEGVQNNKEKLLDVLSSSLKDYTLSQLNKADKTVLLIALYEMLYSNTPKKVVINEALEISKKYGIEKSPKFVNGVLSGVMKKIWVRT